MIGPLQSVLIFMGNMLRSLWSFSLSRRGTVRQGFHYKKQKASCIFDHLLVFFSLIILFSDLLQMRIFLIRALVLVYNYLTMFPWHILKRKHASCSYKQTNPEVWTSCEKVRTFLVAYQHYGTCDHLNIKICMDMKITVIESISGG